MEYILDASWQVCQDEETGEIYWCGGGAADEETRFDPGDYLILDPHQFPVGYRVTGEAPI